LAIFGICSCNDDILLVPAGPNIAGKKVFMVNEGNFQWGNASLAAYSPDSNLFSDQLFKRANSIPIGDVFQSMILHGGSYFLSLNNSGKIIQIDSATLKIQKTYTGFQSPRFMLPIGGKRLLVSDLYSNAISVLNTESGAIEKTIAINGWTEQMIEVADEVWVGNRTNDKIYILDKALLELNDSIVLSHQVNSMVLDKNNKLWVLCQGDAVKKIGGALFCIDPVQKKVMVQMDFTPSDYPFNLRISHNLDSLFYLNEHVFVMPITSTLLPNAEHVNLKGSTPYGLGIEPNASRIYFSDARDFVKPSLISIYSAKGDSLISSFEGGVLCNAFLFPEKK
jgi:hypothetical protein